MITLEQAKQRIGDYVVYQADHANAPVEQGVITSVNHRFVFVRYGTNVRGTATPPERLEFIS